MTEYIKDPKGNLLAFVEFAVVDKNGKIDDNGEYVWVSDMYVNPNCRNNGMIPKFIDRITKRVPKAKYGYYKRELKDNRIRIFDRDHWLGLLNKEE